MSFDLEGLMRWKDPEGPADYASFRQAQQAKAVENYDAPAVSHLPTDEQELHQFATEDMTWTNYPDMITENNRKIAELEQELSQLEKQYGNADDMDRRLAANRARIGDLGNSQAHQQRIENRKTMAASNAKDLEGQRDDIINKIRNIDLSLSYATDSKVQNELKTQRQYLMGKLAKIGGSYVGSSAMSGNGASSDALRRFITMNTDNAGLWKSLEGRQQAQAMLDNLMEQYGDTIDTTELEQLKQLVGAETPAEKQYREQRDTEKQQQEETKGAWRSNATGKAIEESNKKADSKKKDDELKSQVSEAKKAQDGFLAAALAQAKANVKTSLNGRSVSDRELEGLAKQDKAYKAAQEAVKKGSFTHGGKTWKLVAASDGTNYWSAKE